MYQLLLQIFLLHHFYHLEMIHNNADSELDNGSSAKYNLTNTILYIEMKYGASCKLLPYV